MPGHDGTGPAGLGPRTGWGLGPCGAGLGFRRGFSRGRSRGFLMTEQATLTETDKKKLLESELKEIETERKEIEKRLKELK